MTEVELSGISSSAGIHDKEKVTEISGRGVGLDAVQAMVREVRGGIRVWAALGKGTTFQMRVPLTLSIVKTVLAEIGENRMPSPWLTSTGPSKCRKKNSRFWKAASIFNSKVDKSALSRLGRFSEDARHRLVEKISVIVIGDKTNCYGLAVEKFLGEREFAVKPLDSRLGKVKDISSGAFMDDGSPVLIVDLEDIVRSVEKLVPAGTLGGLQGNQRGQL